MKNIILPIVLLVIVIGFTVLNGVLVSNSLNKLIYEAHTLPDIPDDNTLDKIKSIEEKWNKSKEYYSAVSKFDTMHNISKEFGAVKAGCITDDPGTYFAAKESLITAFEYLKDMQSFRLDNII